MQVICCMTSYQAVLNLPYKSGLPRDVSQLTFAFNGPSPSSGVYDEITARVQSWINVMPPTGSAALSRYISQVVDRPKCFIEIYDISSLPAGPPKHRHQFTLGTSASGQSLPLEVALCSSFQGDRVGVEPQRRRRGRVYLGPLNVAAMGGTADDPRPATDLMTNLRLASAELAYENGNDGITWCVWSRKDDLLVTITNGWVNNEWDTQRRREGRETLRQLWGTTEEEEE